jgi:DNA-binding XRE family transcriptional regulator
MMASYDFEIMKIIEDEVQRREAQYARAFNAVQKADYWYSAQAMFHWLRGNLTLKEISELTGVSVGFWLDVEKGRSNPSLQMIEQIATKLGKRMAIVFFDDEDADNGK